MLALKSTYVHQIWRQKIGCHIINLLGFNILFLLYYFYHFSLLLALQCQMSPDIMHWGGAGPKRPGSNICPVQEQIDLWIHYWWPWKIHKDQHKFAAQKWNSQIHIWHLGNLYALVDRWMLLWKWQAVFVRFHVWTYDLSSISCYVLALSWN